MHSIILFVSLLVVSVLATESCGPGLPVPECGVFRNYDGSCNNPVNHNWGKSGNYLMRGAEGVRFVDLNGTRWPVLTPNMRNVSNDLFRADEAKVQQDGLNLLWTFFGQFISHDLMGVNRKGDNGIDQLQPTNNSDVFITVPLEQPNDVFFSTNPAVLLPINVPYIRVLRSRGDMVNGVFQVGSESNSFLDLDTVYGKEEAVAKLLRKGSGGELASRVYDNYKAIQRNGPGSIPGSFTTISPNYTGFYGEWLPLVADVDPNRTHIPISPQLVPAFVENIPRRFFASGDPRNGENYGLNTFQGLFLRNHNRIARAAAARFPTWNDEKIFQHARNLNIAQYQAIIMNEFLPVTLNDDIDLIDEYQGYDVWTDPQASQLFAFAFRFGHSTVPDSYSLKNKCGKPVFNSSRDGPRSSQAAGIFMPADQLAENEKPEHVVHALLFNNAKAVDVQFPEQLRTIPFGANTDVVLQNQLRAADNGIPDYNTIRKLWSGLRRGSVYDIPSCRNAGGSETTPEIDPIECWNVINSNTTVANTLRNLYKKVNNLNFYTAVVAEENTRFNGAVVGQTPARIIADQFKRSRDGDRFWFENLSNKMFTRGEIAQLKNTRISDLLKLNFPGANVPSGINVPRRSAFYVPLPRFFKTAPCN